MNYYQYQNGGGGMITVYRGSPNQRGHEIGTFLKGLFRAAMPIVKKGARVIGKELFHSGYNFLDDLDNDVPARSAFNNRMDEAKGNLKRKAVDTLLGRGRVYKTKRQRKSIQSKPSSQKRKTSRKKKNKRRKNSRKPVRKTKKRKTVKRKTKKRNTRKKTRSKNSSDIFG